MFNFPNSPSVGTTYPSPPVAGQPVYVYDGQKWTIASPLAPGTAAVIISDTVPVGAPANSLFWESDTGMLYVNYLDPDATTPVWVAAMPIPDPSALVRVDTAQTFTATQQAQARANIYAAPFDALAYSGMQVNGSCDVSQANGTSAVTTPASYIVDGWWFNEFTAVMSWSQVADAPPGYTASIKATVTTADASPAASDFSLVQVRIEGYRIARLAFGTASAAPLSIGFWTKTSRTGTYSLTVSSGGDSRAYALLYNQAAAGVWQFNTVTIPGDVTGTWPSDNSMGMRLRFWLMAGTNNVMAPNVWGTAANAATGQINGVAATSDYFQITGLVVLPGIELPSASRAPFIMRPYGQELCICERYFSYAYGTTRFIATAAAQNGECAVNWPVTMRASPTIAIVSSILNGNQSASFPQVGNADAIGCRLMINSAAAGDCYSIMAKISADARL